MIDLLVAGGGPVGLATAVGARLAGLDVAVVEPRGGPIDKACGEGLMPDALTRLRRLGIDPPGVDFHGIRYLRDGWQAEARFSAGPGRGVRRTELQACLAQRAADLGVPVVDGRVDAIVEDGDGIEAAGIRARYLVGADGLHSSVRRLLGLEAATRGRPRFGIRQHFAVEPWTDLVEVHWLPDCEVYVTPVASHSVGVAVLGGAPLSLDDAVARLPALAARLSGSPASSQQAGGRAVPPVDHGADSAGARCWWATPQATSTRSPGRGCGSDSPRRRPSCGRCSPTTSTRYEAEWGAITRSYRWLTNGLLWTSAHPRLRPMIVPAAQRLPFAFRRIVDSLAS